MHTYRLSITEDLNQIPPAPSPTTRVPLPACMWTSAPLTRTGPRSTPLSTTAKPTTKHWRSKARTAWPMACITMLTTPLPPIRPTTWGIRRTPLRVKLTTASPSPIVSTPTPTMATEGARRNRFLLPVCMSFPSGEGRKYLTHSSWLNQVVGGWNVNTITLLETGPSLTPSISPGGCQVAPDPATVMPQHRKRYPGDQRPIEHQRNQSRRISCARTRCPITSTPAGRARITSTLRPSHPHRSALDALATRALVLYKVPALPLSALAWRRSSQLQRACICALNPPLPTSLITPTFCPRRRRSITPRPSATHSTTNSGKRG